MAVSACLLQAASCLPEPLDVAALPTAPEQLVVSTQVISDQSFIVWLTRTFGALEASDHSDPQALVDLIAVNDAVVVLQGPARNDTLRSLGQGLYGGLSIPFEPGEAYTLFVRSSSLGDVWATTTVKPRVAFEKVEAELYDNGFDDKRAQISYTFRDPAQENWYMLTVQEVGEGDLASDFVNPRAFTVLLEDKEFNGSVYGERFRILADHYSPGDTVAVSLSNISEAYYRFMKLRMDNRFSFIELIGEPAAYPSNVKGGRGYFNLYLPDVEVFIFE